MYSIQIHSKINLIGQKFSDQILQLCTLYQQNKLKFGGVKIENPTKFVL